MYLKGAHTKHRMLYHIVWIPKYRKKVLKGKLAERVKELLLECAEEYGWKIIELNIQEDHVHMVVQLKPNISVSKVVQLFKGSSSRIIRLEFPELKKIYWGDSFWGDGYFVETVGKVDLEVIREYVKNQ